MLEITNLPQIIYLGLPIAAIIVALIQVIKTTFVKLPKRFIPGISIALGLVSGAIGFYFTKNINQIYLGLCTGLIACGLFDGGKIDRNKFSEIDKK